ncbi:MAG: hypothetical protein JO287_09405 [Pseudonocardiales bacterium]|nr:hypothetical protein [Pseudonocardiales bacterium]
MTARHDDEKLREVADHHVADEPAVAAQLYADADHLTQLRKTPTNVNRDEITE